MLANMCINFIHYCSFTAEKTLALACAHVVPLLYDIILTQLGVPNVYCLHRAGALPEDHREEWISGPALGALHHTKRRLPATYSIAAPTLAHNCFI